MAHHHWKQHTPLKVKGRNCRHPTEALTPLSLNALYVIQCLIVSLVSLDPSLPPSLLLSPFLLYMHDLILI